MILEGVLLTLGGIIIALYLSYLALNRFYKPGLVFVSDLLKGIIDFKSHYQIIKIAFGTQRKNWWLFIVPLIPLLVMLLIEVYTYDPQITYNEDGSWCIATVTYTCVHLPSKLSWILESMINDFAMCLTLPRIRFLEFFFLVYVALLVLMPVILKRISRWQESLPDVSAKFLKYSVIVVGIMGVFLARGIIWGYIGTFSSLDKESILAPVLLYDLEAFANLFVTSIWFIILFSILLFRMNKNGTNEFSIGRNILIYYKPILTYFAILSIYPFLSTVAWHCKCVFWNTNYDISSFRNFSQPILNVFYYLHLIVSLVLLPLPFIIMLGNLSFKESFKGTFRLYKNCIRQAGGFIIAFIGCAALIIFVAGTINQICWPMWPFSWPGFWFRYLIGFFRVFLSCIAVISLVRILQDTRDLWLTSSVENKDEGNGE